MFILVWIKDVTLFSELYLNVKDLFTLLHTREMSFLHPFTSQSAPWRTFKKTMTNDDCGLQSLKLQIRQRKIAIKNKRIDI